MSAFTTSVPKATRRQSVSDNSFLNLGSSLGTKTNLLPKLAIFFQDWESKFFDLSILYTRIFLNLISSADESRPIIQSFTALSKQEEHL